MTSEKIKSKKWAFGPFSIYPNPPTINRDIFNFIFPPAKTRQFILAKVPLFFWRRPLWGKLRFLNCRTPSHLELNKSSLFGCFWTPYSKWLLSRWHTFLNISCNLLADPEHIHADLNNEKMSRFITCLLICEDCAELLFSALNSVSSL